MVCRSCGVMLLENARFCTGCGSHALVEDIPAQKPARKPPGRPPGSGQLSSAPSQIDVEKAVAAGEYQYDPESHLYYKCEQTVDVGGKSATRVIYYDTITLKVSQAEYLNETAKLPELQYLPVSLDDISDTTTTSLEEIAPPIDGKIRWRRFFIPAILLLFATASVFFLVIGGGYNIIPGFNRPESQAAGWQALPDNAIFAPESMEAERPPKLPPSDAPNEERIAYVHKNWPEFGHISELYGGAKEDERYLYYCPENSPSLYRINKDSATVEIILDISQHGYSHIESFALLGDYLYYTVPMGARSGFFRVHRGGGQAEFIFTDYGGKLIEAENGLYFWSAKANSLMLFNPYEEIFPIEQPELLISEAGDVTCLAVTAKYVYYRETGDDYELFLRHNRESGGLEMLLEANPGEIYNPVVINDMVYFLYQQEEYLLCRAHAGARRIETLQFLGDTFEFPFFAVTQDYIVFRQNRSYYYAPIRYPERMQLILNTTEAPTAVTAEWVLWPSQAYHIPTGRILELTRPGSSVDFDAAPAFAQAESLAGNNNVRNTLLEEPVALGEYIPGNEQSQVSAS